MNLNRLLIFEYLLIFTFFLFTLGWIGKKRNGKSNLHRLLVGVWSVFLLYNLYVLIIQHPVFNAVSKDNYKKVENILKEKPELIRARKLLGDSLLHEAVKKADLEMVSLLIKKGADPNAKNIDEITPLHIAAEINSIPIAEILIKNGADVQARGFRNELTPLQVAVIDGHIEMVKILKKYGADLNAVSKDGKTALDFAKEREKKEIQKYLEAMNN